MHTSFVLLSLLCILSCVVQAIFPQYGYYCGGYRADGRLPLDELDKYCQIYDVCMKATTSCFCSEQLYYLASNVVPKSDPESASKDLVLSEMYKAIAFCTNGYYFDSIFSIGTLDEYFFLPIYGQDSDRSGYQLGTSGDSVYYYLTDKYEGLDKEITQKGREGMIRLTSTLLYVQFNSSMAIVIVNWGARVADVTIKDKLYSPPTGPAWEILTGYIIGMSVAIVIVVGLGIAVAVLCVRSRKETAYKIVPNDDKETLTSTKTNV
jgi:hypothetical protein